MLSPVLGSAMFYMPTVNYFYRAYSAKHNSQSLMKPGLYVALLYFSLFLIFLCAAQTRLYRTYNRSGWVKPRR